MPRVSRKPKEGNGMSDLRTIGTFSQAIIDLLGLNIVAGTPIYIGQENIDHMKARHPTEFEMYYDRIEEVISEPDYVRNNTKNASIDFVKTFYFGSDHVQVSVRVDSTGRHFARTLFLLMSYKFERFVKDGTLVKPY